MQYLWKAPDASGHSFIVDVTTTPNPPQYMSQWELLASFTNPNDLHKHPVYRAAMLHDLSLISAKAQREDYYSTGYITPYL